ncbi:hypothetical protein AXZ77_2563 [Thioclava sp. ES.031]|uniref:DUF4177 domain-containing protein n=1 Tax=Thioclava sp. ES.031 TaxID=1798203 RepID=UPI000BF7B9C0|nr:DUF4177 domain-containing protein [Thioclava sp. ES.031]PFG63940.1 hypothetical protein AXZ77_2563 [Thioclava sp. ES.031]
MQHYEYKVIPAPARGDKERGLKTGADRFAHALSGVMNEMATRGWEYLRAETLPAEERTGLTGKSTVYHNLLVFRRPTSADPARAVGAHPDPEDAANDEDAPEAKRRALLADAPEGRAPKLRANRDGTSKDED